MPCSAILKSRLPMPIAGPCLSVTVDCHLKRLPTDSAYAYRKSLIERGPTEILQKDCCKRDRLLQKGQARFLLASAGGSQNCLRACTGTHGLKDADGSRR
jgi:hypothetical protein